MALLPRALTILGAILLAHACYSAHEHSSLHTISPSLTASTLASSSASSTSSSISLPLDITLETLFSILIICLGLVLGSPALKPISWRVWAGQIEREGRKEGMGLGEGMNPFAGLESRAGFLDIRAKRREFADWVRERDAVVKT
ncbi:MAG: hypothetical protein M1830_003957 [Pleopsidium flavum]|nr:MAG: hypothetical protein M1830_003957 [Pleopsidium flavum]